MIEHEEKHIQRVYHLLIATLLVLLCSQLITFIFASVQYLFGVVLAVVVAAMRYFYLKKRGAGHFEKALTFFIVLMAVFGPVIFLLVKWLIVGEPLLGVETLMILLFVIPIGLLLYCIFLLRKLLPA